MLTIERMRGIQMSPRPIGHQIVSEWLLRWSYQRPPRTQVEVDGLEHLTTAEPMFIAMNHTDRFNYLPLLARLHRHDRYAACWVKAKYFDNPVTSIIMGLLNQIPLPSRGYFIAHMWADTFSEAIDSDTYRRLRDVVDGESTIEAALSDSEKTQLFIGAHGGQSFAEVFEERFALYMSEVVGLTERALQAGLHVLVFPEGTRSTRLGEGRSGIVQVAHHLGVPIVPVGCSGSDLLYPGNAPFSHGGSVHYRVGAPMEFSSGPLSQFRIDATFRPLSRSARLAHNEHFGRATSVVMDAINTLLEPRYQRPTDPTGDQRSDIGRFV